MTKNKQRIFLVLTSVCIALMPIVIYGAVMQSPNYKIQSDTINVGGNDLSGSAGYKIGDTIGETGTGVSNSASYTMNAGWRQMQSTYISITTVGDTSLPAISTLFGGVSETSLTWTVTTDDPAGYSLSVAADTTPALKSAISDFDDYTPAGANPDFTFTVAPGASAFGFSPEGADILDLYKDDGISSCNTGAFDSVKSCWVGFSTTPTTVAQRTSSNQPSGTDTTLELHAEVGSAFIQESGTYSASLTVTAVAL